MISGRGKKLDLSTIKCVVVDEADVFFLDDRNFKTIKGIANYKDIKTREEGKEVQWVFFSATFPDGSDDVQAKVDQNMREIVEAAN